VILPQNAEIIQVEDTKRNFIVDKSYYGLDTFKNENGANDYGLVWKRPPVIPQQFNFGTALSTLRIVYKLKNT
jgi:hypothetical protein